MDFRKLLTASLVVVVMTGCDSGAVTTESSYATDSAAQAEAAGLSHGEYVARLGNCAACHSIPEGEPLRRSEDGCTHDGQHIYHQYYSRS